MVPLISIDTPFKARPVLITYQGAMCFRKLIILLEVMCADLATITDHTLLQ